jgi:type VI secretion system secreted protein VgrG
VLALLGMIPGVDAVGSERGANALLSRDDAGNPNG